MIDILETGEALVNTFPELKQVLEDATGAYKDVTYVYVLDDVDQPTEGIRVPKTKPDVTIDGAYNGMERRTWTTPGRIQSYSITPDLSTGDEQLAMRVTLQNFIVINSNYYGLLSTPATAVFTNVTLIHRNLVYDGEQSCHIPYGTVEYHDCDITSNVHEIAECSRVVLGGKTTINQTNAYNGFVMVYNPDLHRVTILDDADVTIVKPSLAMVNCSANASFIMGARAKLKLTAPNGISSAATSRFTTFSVGEDAELTIESTTGYAISLGGTFELMPRAKATFTNTGSAFNCVDAPSLILGEEAVMTFATSTGISAGTGDRFGAVTLARGAVLTSTQTANGYTLALTGTLEVGEDAVMELVKTTGTSAPLWLYGGGGNVCSITINNPKRFRLHNGAGNTAVYFYSTTPALFSVSGGQINLWNNAPGDGGFTDLPTYSWRKTAVNQIEPTAYFSGSSSGGSFAPGADTNLEGDELAGKPLTSFVLDSAYALVVGKLPLTADVITDDGWPISGATDPEAMVRVTYPDEEFTVQAGSDGGYSVDTTAPIPLGESVTVTANLPYLLTSRTMTVVEVGELILLETPARLEFDFTDLISVNPRIYARSLDNWTIRVKDSRARSTPWTLTAAIDGQMQVKDGQGRTLHALPDSLIFMDEQSESRPLGESPLTVWQESGNSGDITKVVEVVWPREQGILLTSPEPILVKEAYTTNINWDLTISETP